MSEPEKSPLDVRPDFEGFADVVALLRQECPWDRKQTHASLRKHLLEETYETLEAIDRLSETLDEGGAEGDAEGGAEGGENSEQGSWLSQQHLAERKNGAEGSEKTEQGSRGSEQGSEKTAQQLAAAKSLCDELGDLLYQVFFHSLLASERDDFDVYDVVASIQAKLVRRHPHVFGDLEVESEEDLAPHWEAIKKSEGKRESVMDGIPSELPALLYASKVQRKAASLGAKPPEMAVPLEMFSAAASTAPIDDQIPIDDQTIGRQLFAITQLAAQQGIDSEAALRSAAQSFKDRFRQLEEQGKDLAAEESRDYLWRGEPN